MLILCFAALFAVAVVARVPDAPGHYTDPTWYERASVIFIPYADNDAVPVPDGEHLPFACQSIAPMSEVV